MERAGVRRDIVAGAQHIGGRIDLHEGDDDASMGDLAATTHAR
jgi:hypothetical protein